MPAFEALTTIWWAGEEGGREEEGLCGAGGPQGPGGAPLPQAMSKESQRGSCPPPLTVTGVSFKFLWPRTYRWSCLPHTAASWAHSPPALAQAVQTATSSLAALPPPGAPAAMPQSRPPPHFLPGGPIFRRKLLLGPQLAKSKARGSPDGHGTLSRPESGTADTRALGHEPREP